jgi:hypothetical protein
MHHCSSIVNVSQRPNAHVQLQGTLAGGTRKLDVALLDAGTQTDAGRPCRLQHAVR